MFTARTLRAKLPKLGETRMETPTVDETPGHSVPKKPKMCVVVYVNPEHVWYTVQFNDGTRESYKLPPVKPVGGVDYV